MKNFKLRVLVMAAMSGGSCLVCVATAHAAEKLTPDEMKVVVGAVKKLAGQKCQAHDGDACVRDIGFVSGAGSCKSTQPVAYSECVVDETAADPNLPVQYCTQDASVKTCQIYTWNPANAAGFAIGATAANCRNGGVVTTSLSDVSSTDPNGCV